VKALWLDREIAYDGTQLRSHWIYQQSGELGDAIAAFVGAADVPLAHMVDLVDVALQAPIFSKRMLHFIVEHFDVDLSLAIVRQRLLAAIAAEELHRRVPAEAIERRGDDLYDGERKISVSIATASPVSCLIHFAMNIRSDGTPVPTKGLADYGIDPRALADALLARYVEEIDSMATARCKVRAVE
jgi:uncharacterized protein